MNADEKEIERLFAGTWEHDRHENLEKFLDAAGIGSVKKLAITKISPTQTIAVVVGKDNECTIEMTIAGGPMKQTTSCKLGKEHKVSGVVDGTGVTELKDGKLITNVTPADSKTKPQIVTREIVGEELKMTLECDGVCGIRYFKKKGKK